MHEDTSGTATVNPGFGVTGTPAVINPPKVPHTFPAYTFTEF